jgi:CRP-like cAMP-binding protein
MSFLHKHPKEWLSDDVVASRPAVEQRLIDQILHHPVPPTVREIEADTDLFKQGYFAQAVHVVLSGEMMVVVDGEEVAHLGPGSVFGEMAMLGRRVRTGTITALVPTTIASRGESSVEREDLRELAESRGFHTEAD